jgi:adenylate cyclase
MATTTATRRLTAILAADVVGYSRLMGADEEGTHERFKAHLRELVDPKIREHHGRIVKTTGDGVLVEFASVIDAVRWAVEVQQSMAERDTGVGRDNRIELRIGINLGDVIVEGDDLYGDGVNIAARVEALADAGGVFVSNTVHDHVRDRLPFVFEDLGEQQVKNIARPVRVYRVRAGGALPSSLPPAGEESARLGATELPMLPLPDKPSVAVLPLHMSGDPEQEFFADGIAEDVITAPARYPSLFVVARNSSFTYKSHSVDVKQVGRELGVRYVLEGSLRKSGNRIRISAQLVEAETGNHVWAERYDRDLADIFAVQDEISEAVTIAIAPAMAGAEQQRAIRKLPDSLGAWAADQRGLWHFSNLTAADNALAEKFFLQSIDLDANFAGGDSGLAWARLTSASQFQTRALGEVQVSAEPLIRRAISLDNADAEARACLSFWLFQRGDSQGALIEAERALAMTPNLASAHHMLGAAMMQLGRPNEALAPLETSIRLDPSGPFVMIRRDHVVAALYQSCQSRSISAARRS